MPNRACVCLSAWCVSDLLVVRVCMCVCTFNSMLLYDFFFPPSVENLSHFGCIRKGWEFKCWYLDFFCDPLTTKGDVIFVEPQEQNEKV